MKQAMTITKKAFLIFGLLFWGNLAFGQNNAPVAVNDTIYPHFTSYESWDLLANDFDIDGNQLLMDTILVSPPSHGVVQLNSDGMMTYYKTTFSYNNMVDYFSYQVCDGTGLCDTATVMLDTRMEITQVVHTPPTSCNSNDGSISIFTINNNPNYQFSIDYGTTWYNHSIFNNLPAGDYPVKIRNKVSLDEVYFNYWYYNQSPRLAPSTIPQLDSVTKVLANCLQSNGSLTIHASCDTAMLYSIDDGFTWQVDSVFNNLSIGAYPIKLKRADGSCEIFYAHIYYIESGNFSISSVDVIDGCNTNDVSIDVNPWYFSIPIHGGLNTNQHYSIDSGLTWQSSSIFNNVAVGTYHVMMNDPNFTCPLIYAKPIIITDEQMPVITSISTINNSACGIDDGTITINAIGNDLEYSIDDGTTWHTNNTFSNLAAGTYLIKVKNQYDCIESSLPFTTIGHNNAPIISNVQGSHPTDCDNNDGQIVITATGGTAPLQYSIDNGNTFQSSGTFTGLSSGEYNIVVQNTNGTCPVSYQKRTILNRIQGVFVNQIITVNPTAPTAFDGEINISAYADLPHEFSIDGGATWIPNCINFTNLSVGTYPLFVRYSDGSCVRELATIVLGSLDYPVQAGPDTYALPHGQILSANVTANDSDPDGLPLTCSLVSQNIGSSTLNFNADGTFTFIPDTSVNYPAIHSFNFVYEVCDAPIMNGQPATCLQRGVTIRYTSSILLGGVNTTLPTCADVNSGVIGISGQYWGEMEFSLDSGATWQISDNYYHKNTKTYTSVPPGTYNLLIRHVYSNTIFPYENNPVVFPTPILPIIDSVNTISPTNCNTTNGSIIVNASGGIGSYEYSIDNGVNWQTSDTFMVSCGNYMIAIKNDDETCPTGYLPLMITGNNAPIAVDDYVNVLKNTPLSSNIGANDIEPDGDVVFYTTSPIMHPIHGVFTLDSVTGDFSYTPNFNFVGQDSFQYIICDTITPFLCDTAMVFIDVVDSIDYIENVNFTHLSYCTDNRGTITIQPYSFFNNLEYSIDNGVTWSINGGHFTNLTAGSYNIIVREIGTTNIDVYDNNPIIISAQSPPSIQWTTLQNVLTQCNDSSGYISINAYYQSGSGIYEYSIDGGTTWQTSKYFYNLGAGTYYPTIRNMNSACQHGFSLTHTISGPNMPSITNVNTLNPTNCSINDGTITITATGGSGSYEYSIDNGVNWFSNNGLFTNLASGVYNVKIRNAGDNLCDVFYPQLTLTAPNTLNINNVTTTNPTSCGVNDGTIIIAANGSLEYSIDNGLTWQLSSTFTNLNAGIYNIRIKTLNGTCETAYLGNPVVLSNASTTITVQNVHVSNTGNNGSITINATDGTATLAYSVDGYNWQNNNMFTGLVNGIYPVYIRNINNNCIFNYGDIVLSDIGAIDSVITLDAACGQNNGSISIQTSINSINNQYSIDSGLTWQSATNFTNLSAGNYNVIIRNMTDTLAYANNPVVISSISSPILTIGNDTTVCANSTPIYLNHSPSGGTWSGVGITDTIVGVFDANVVGIGSSDVIYTFTQSANCTVSDTMTITVATLPNVYAGADTSFCIYEYITQLNPGFPSGGYWYGMGIINSLTGEFVPQFAGPGDFDIFYNYTDTITGCSNTDTLIASVDYFWYDNYTYSNDSLILNFINYTNQTLEYSIDSGLTWQSSNTFYPVTSGSYDVVARVATVNSCMTYPYTITLTPIGINNVIAANLSNCTTTDGSISISAYSDSSALEYSIDNGLTWQSNSNFNSLPIGSYNILIRTNIDTLAYYNNPVQVTAPASAIISNVVSINPSTCFSYNGRISVTASGTGQFVFSIDGGSSWHHPNQNFYYSKTKDFIAQPEGTYQIRVRNIDETCEVAAPDVILTAQNGTISIDSVTSVTPTNSITNDGSITINATGGTPPLSYSIDGGTTWQNSNVFNNIDCGIYDVQVSNYNYSCPEIYGQVNLDCLTLTAVNSTNASCSLNDATIAITAEGGTGTYQYSIDSGLTWQTVANFNNLSEGSYNVLITDISDTLAYANNPVTITAPNVPIVDSIFSSPPQFCSMNVGMMIIHATGSDLDYSIDGGLTWQNSGMFMNLSSGMYFVQVRDSISNCVADYANNPVSFLAPTAPPITNVSIINPTNCGVTDGTITILATGGSLEYSINDGISWFPNGGFFTGLSGGTYAIRVRNANGTCEVVYPNVTLTDKVPPTITNVTFTNPTNCGVFDGTITITASGVDPLQYSIDAGTTWLHYIPGLITFPNTFTGLGAGTYQIRVRNVDGTCMVNYSDVTLTSSSTINAGNDTTICNNPFNTTLSPGFPLGGHWSGPGILDPVPGIFNGVIAGGIGTYQVFYTYINSNGCSNSDTLNITVSNSIQTNINAGNDTTVCINSNPIQLNGLPSGGYWLIAGIVDVNGFFDPATAGIGTHQVFYTDGCSIDTLAITVTPPPTIWVANDTTVCEDSDTIFLSASPLGGYWTGVGVVDSSGIFIPSLAGVGANVLTYTYSDGNSCIVNPTQIITTVPLPVVYAGTDQTYCLSPNNIALAGYSPVGGIWSGSGIVDATGGIFNSILAGGIGSYDLVYTYTSSNGCSNFDTLNVTVIAPDTVDAGNDRTVCINSGGIALIPSIFGGVWIGAGMIDPVTGIFDPVFAGVGTHEITYTFGTGTCVVSDTITVTVAADASFANVNYQYNNDSLTINLINNNGLEYSIDSGLTWQSSNIFYPVPFGNYTLAVQNANSVNCPAYQNLVLQQPIAVNDTFTNIGLNISIIGNVTANDTAFTQVTQLTNPNYGTITNFTANGTFTYVPTTGFLNDLDSFQYEICDGINVLCDTATVYLAINDTLYFTNVSTTNPTHCSFNDGAIQITALGISTVEYSINNGSTWQSSGVFANLSGGTYNVTIRNLSDTIAYANPIVLAAPNVPVITNVIKTNPTSCLASNGSVQILSNNPSGLLYYSTYTATWQSSNTFSGLNCGAYQFWVKNNNNTCQTYVGMYILHDTLEIVSVTSQDKVCGQDEGKIEIQLTQGTTNYQYSIDSGLTWQSVDSFTNLIPGDYHIFVNDGLNTIAYANNPIVINEVGMPTITALYGGDFVYVHSIAAPNLEYSLDCGATWQNNNFFNGISGTTFCSGVRYMDGSCPLFSMDTFVNTVPFAVNDMALFPKLNVQTLNILNNDFDAEGNSLYVTTPPTISFGSASVTVDSLGNLTIPTADFSFGTYHFNYTACEIFNPANCSSASVTFTIYPPPHHIFDTMAIGATAQLCIPNNLNSTPVSLTNVCGTIPNVVIDSIVGECLYLYADNYGNGMTCFAMCDNLGFCDTTYLYFNVQDGVWPGDADDNTVVNNFDLLNVGLGYGTSGTARDSITNVWNGYITPLWNVATPVSNVDYRHLDGNGDGFINADDTLAIMQNYGLSYQRGGGGNFGTPLSVLPDTNYVLPYFSMPIHLGELSNPAGNIYGGAFSILYDTTYIKKDSVFITFNNSWVGTKNVDMLSIDKNFGDNQQIDVAFTRINGTNVTGFGEIGQLNFTIKDDILQRGMTLDSVIFDFHITNVKFISADEQEVNIAANSTAWVVFSTTSTNSVANLAQWINIFPNPTTNYVQIQSQKLTIENITVTDMVGRTVLENIPTDKRNIQLNISELPQGVYHIQLQTERGMVVKQLVVLE